MHECWWTKQKGGWRIEEGEKICWVGIGKRKRQKKHACGSCAWRSGCGGEDDCERNSSETQEREREREGEKVLGWGSTGTTFCSKIHAIKTL